jgi:TIR domain
MASVFMSFIHEEESAAKLVHDFIRHIFGPTIDTFISSDKNAIYAGEDWMNRIFEELKTTKVLVSMLSPDSVKRPWINFEAGAATALQAKVIPVCIGGLTINQLPKPYSILQAVEIDTHEGAHYLLSSVAHHLGMTLPKKPNFWDDLPSSWSEAEKKDNKTLVKKYEIFQSLLKANLGP